ncbi:MAG: TlpA disulfide reductase family protein [Saprospiraceae bacterium]
MLNNCNTGLFWPLILAFVSCASTKGGGPVPVEVQDHRAIDDRLGRIQMTDLEGRRVSLSDFARQPVFLNFWATWCQPCIQEMSSIETLYQRYGEEIVFLAASHEDLEVIRSFQERHGVRFPLVRLDVDYIDAFIISLPTTLLIDREGHLVHEEEGIRLWNSENYERKVKELLQE